MDAHRWNRLMRLFAEAVELNADDRRVYLERHCADDDDLRCEVESLIRNDNAGTRFRGAIGDIANQAYPSSGIAGESIGPYRLVRELGRGGMGAVWLAARDDDEYQSEVAIKLIRNLSGTQIRARFLAERQILANLNHPNIARLLDGGTTAAGAPYVVMEFVPGEPIDEYCEKQQLRISERIRLFCAVCDAVQYAHRSLIVHRDIKPANILVDSGGSPKLLDFGIAKLVDPEESATLSTPVTMDGFRMLTPQYASPEQIRGQPITTSSDVYSLGVLLCKLLTGHLPYHTKEGDSLDLARAICETEPERPSTIVRHGGANEPANSAHTNQGRRLAGDLDNIVLKALRKEPDARYSSVNEFEDDLQRHLNRLPVRARPATWHYRLARFTSRHRWAVASAAVAAAGLIAATAFSIFQMDTAIQARHIAEQERSIAISEGLRATLTAALSAVGAADPVAAMRLLKTVAAEDRGWEWSHISSGLDQSIAEVDARDTVAIGLSDSGNLITVSDTGLIRWWSLSEARSSTRIDVGTITRGRFSPDGSRLAVVRGSGLLELWDLQDPDSPQRVFQYQFDDNPIDLALSSDGSRLAAVTKSEVITWAAGSDKISRWSPNVTPTAITMSANGSRIGLLIGNGRNGSYRLFDAAGREITRSHASDVIGLALSPDGTLAATAELDRTIRLREAPTARVLERFQGHSPSANVVAFSLDGRRFASGGADQTVRVWSRNLDEPDAVLSGHTGPIQDLHVNADGRRVASMARDGTARLWDAQRDARPELLPGHWAAFFADGSKLATLDEFGALRLFDVASQEQFDALIAGGLASTTLAASPAGRFLATANQDKVVLIDASRLSETMVISVDSSDIVSLTFSPTDDRLLILQASGKATVYDTTSMSATMVVERATSRSGDAAFSPDGSRFATTHEDTVIVWNALTGEIVHLIRVSDATVHALDYSPDGTTIASGWSDGVIRVLDASSDAFVAQLSAHADSVRALAFSPDGTRLASGARDSTVWIWDVETARPLLRFSELSDTVQSLEFSADGSKLVGSSASNEVRIWDTVPARARWDAGERLREERDAMRPTVAGMFERSADPDIVATLLRNDLSLGELERTAALQLTLDPPALANTVIHDPFDGHALEFDGDDSHVVVKNPDALRMTRAFTIETWVFPLPFDTGETPLSLRMIFNKEGEYQVAVRPNGQLLWVIAGPQGWLGWVETRYRLVPDRWTHIALVRDGAKIKFYVNGRLVQNQSVPDGIGDQHNLMNEFRIGGRQHTPSSFRGRIDEMRVWSTTRTSEQIQKFLCNRPQKDEPGLLAAWSFDEGESSTTEDRRGQHAGTIVDAIWVETSIESD